MMIKIDDTTRDLIKELKGNKKVSDDFIVWKSLLKAKFEGV